jgi:peptidoglycan/LPS O-acetylase OafA/YrhL
MNDILAYLDFGRLGVVVFFAISGYVIPKSLDPGDKDAGRKFLIRRFFRLFPAYWLSIPLGFATIWWLQGRPFPIGDVLLNFTMAPGLLGAKEVMGLYWTLAYELAFYVACLALWRLGWLSRPWTMLALAYLMLAAGAACLLASYVTHRGALGGWALTCFCYGIMFTGAAWRRHRDGLMVSRWERLAGLGVLLIWLVGLPVSCLAVIAIVGRYLDYFVRVPIAYGGGLAIFLLLTTVARINWRPLAWVGLVSYSLYLFHPVVLYGLAWGVKAMRAKHVDVALLMGVEFVLAIALAGAVFQFVERPAIALGRRLSA